MEKRAVILFTKIPVAGSCKTRLRPFLSDDECVFLQEAFIMDMLSEIGETGIDIIACVTPESGVDYIKSAVKNDIIRTPQIGEGLGIRMFNAFNYAFDSGFNSCVLVGSDVPLLTKRDLEAAFEILKNRDIVLYPAKDGGYCLIGMKEAYGNVFNMEYSHKNVFTDTCAAVNKMSKSLGIGGTFFDIDEKGDLIELWKILTDNPQYKCTCTRKAVNNIMRGKIYE